MCVATAVNNASHHASLETFDSRIGRNWSSVCSVPLKLISHGDCARLKSGRRHHATNEIVTEQMHVELVANTLRRFASQMVHLQNDLEAPQMQLRLPSPPVSRRESLSGGYSPASNNVVTTTSDFGESVITGVRSLYLGRAHYAPFALPYTPSPARQPLSVKNGPSHKTPRCIRPKKGIVTVAEDG